MDERFQPAIEAIQGADVDAFRRIIAAQPELASARSSKSHPTLLQLLVTDGRVLPAEVQRAVGALLVDGGAQIDEALIACGSGGNVCMAGFLVDRGAKLDGDPEFLRGWTVLEEALYWGFPELVALLVARGARVRNLRTAAGLGELERLRSFFDGSGALDAGRAGAINWPFGKDAPEQGSREAQALLDNALVYAAMNGNADATRFLVERGAGIDSIPPGFHYPGTALHWTAIRGNRAMCELLLELGAVPTILDPTFDNTAAGWAREGENEPLAVWLDSR